MKQAILPYSIRGRLPLIAAVLAGSAAFAMVPSRFDMIARILGGWDFGAFVLLVLTLATMVACSTASHMRQRAAQQDEGRWVILAILILGAGASLVAPMLIEQPLRQSGAMTIYIALASGTMLLSWLVLHTIFALHYAHSYYGPADDEDGLVGGLEFPGEKQPDYFDFMYFSFVVGMTCQVSDVQVTSRMLRRMTLLHGIVAFFFNTIIVALTINILASRALR